MLFMLIKECLLIFYDTQYYFLGTIQRKQLFFKFHIEFSKSSKLMELLSPQQGFLFQGD